MDLIVQSLLIVFSVLFALFLDGIWEQQKVTTDLRAAYREIRGEVESNRNALTAAVAYHRQSMATMDSVLNKGSVETSEFSGSLSQIMPKGLLPPDLQNAAWNTLHSTGLAAQLKFDDLYPLTHLYQLQEEEVKKTQRELEALISQSGRFEKQRNAFNLNELKSLLNKLYEQEKRLLTETNTALNAGRNWRYLE